MASETPAGLAGAGPETSTVLRPPRRRIWRRATHRLRQVWWGQWWETRLDLKGVEAGTSGQEDLRERCPASLAALTLLSTSDPALY
jgi:hypothetical protein